MSSYARIENNQMARISQREENNLDVYFGLNLKIVVGSCQDVAYYSSILSWNMTRLFHLVKSPRDVWYFGTNTQL